MAILRMDHVGVVVDDLEAAIAFFVALGLEAGGGGEVGGADVDRIVGLDGVRCAFAFVRTPDGHSQLEVIEFATPASPDARPEPANVPGLRHLCFAVDDLDATIARVAPLGGELLGEVVAYGNSYRLCYLRGPAGIIVELAEKLA